MTCPKCNKDMEEGITGGMYWTPRSTLLKTNQKIGAKFSLIKMFPVIAWKCPNCKKIELESLN